MCVCRGGGGGGVGGEIFLMVFKIEGIVALTIKGR